MHFTLTPAQQEFQRKAASFARQRIEPVIPVMEQTGRPPAELIAAMGEQGFMRVRLPGSDTPGMNHLEQILLLEALSRYSAAIGLLMVSQLMGIGTLMEFAGPAVREHYLPRLTTGEMLLALGITEPSGGSDPSAAGTRAERDGDCFVLTGRKVFITNSHWARLVLVVARTSADRRRGLSVFAVDATTPGFRTGRAEHKTGLVGCVTGELVFDQCRVPESHLIGEEGDGLAITIKAISEYGRMGNAGVALGLMQTVFEETQALAAAVGQLYQPMVQEGLAAIYGETQAARLLTYQAAWLLDTGARADAEVATTKFFANDASLRCIRRAMAIAGSRGLVAGHPLERCFRDAIPLISADGTGDIQRIVAARSLVGRFS